MNSMSKNMENPSSSVLTITAKNMDEVYQKLFEMYQSNYRIINHHTILQGGFLGLFQKTRVKATYMLVNEKNNETDDFVRTKNEILAKELSMATEVKKNTQMINQVFQDLTTKIDEIRSNTSNNIHPSIQKIEELMIQNEFPHSFISYVSSRIASELSFEKLNDFDFVQKKTVDIIGESISIAPLIHTKFPHIFVFVGPTGVGKTTTLSKLSAGLVINARKEKRPAPVVRLITTDYTRVGAEEQLRRFGDLMDVKVEKAETAEDLSSILEKWRDTVDYIFIDSSGCSPNDYDMIAKMRKTLSLPEDTMETFLVVSASTISSNLVKIIDNFSIFNFDSVIVTKCDETSSFGNVVGVLHEKRKSISYITNGQSVPRAIKRASVLYFLNSLTGFKLDKMHLKDKFPEEN